MKQPKFILYINLQQELLKDCDAEGCIDYIKVKERILLSRLKKKIIPTILKEMEFLGLGERISNFKFKVNNIKQEEELKCCQ